MGKLKNWPTAAFFHSTSGTISQFHRQQEAPSILRTLIHEPDMTAIEETFFWRKIRQPDGKSWVSEVVQRKDANSLSLSSIGWDNRRKFVLTKIRGTPVLELLLLKVQLIYISMTIIFSLSWLEHLYPTNAWHRKMKNDTSYWAMSTW